MKPNFKTLLRNISTFIFDVDGVLTNGLVTVMPNGEILRQLNIRDSYAIKTALDKGYNVSVFSSGSCKGFKEKLIELGIKNVYTSCHDKKDQLEEFMIMNDLKADQILYMGDDVPDRAAMELAGVAACPEDASHEIKSISIYVSQKKGGEGCVRDVIEQVLKLHGKWDGEGKFQQKK